MPYSSLPCRVFQTSKPSKTLASPLLHKRFYGPSLSGPESAQSPLPPQGEDGQLWNQLSKFELLFCFDDAPLTFGILQVVLTVVFFRSSIRSIAVIKLGLPHRRD